MTTKTSYIAASLLALTSLVTLLGLRYLQVQLRVRNQALQEHLAQLAQRGTGKPMGATAPSALSEAQLQASLHMRGEVGKLRREQDKLGQLRLENRRLQTNLANLLLEGKVRVRLEQLAPYLEAKQRNAESLLAAYQITQDPSVLREALEKYPSDPRVNLAALSKSRSPEECRQRLDAFKQSAPDNALANYLSAQDYFKAGQSDQALQELVAAAGKSNFQYYSGDFLQNLEEAYWAAGCSTAGAGLVAAYSLPVEQFAQLRGLGKNMGELAALYRQAGDEASAQTALQMGLALGRQVGEPSAGKPTCLDLLGIEVEQKFLAAMDSASPYNNAGITVKDRLDELARKRETIKEVGGDGGIWVSQLSEQDQMCFFDRMKAFGELEALRWARNKQGKP